MQIFMSGGYHNNPLQRKKLKKWLEDQKAQHGVPLFIATEANRAIYYSVIKFQRENFIRQAENDNILGRINRKYLKELSKAIGYEDDTHFEVFPNYDKTLWLDDVRPDFDTTNDLCAIAERHIDNCKSAIEKSGLELDPCVFRKYKLFKAIDEYIKYEADEYENSISEYPNKNNKFDRDNAWMKMLSPQLSENKSKDYGIIIVGENHTKNEPHYLRYLLSEAGHDCKIKLLQE